MPDEQQLQDQTMPNPNQVLQSNSSTTWHSSSGSIGPFFTVISVLTVLAIISCVLGRYCSRRTATSPMQSINRTGCLWWLKGRLGWCMAGEYDDAEVGDHATNVCKA